MKASEKMAEVRKKLANLTDAEKDALKAKAVIVSVEGHALSPINTMMVYIQAHANGLEPMVVGGYRQWQKAGRQIRKGQHGFSIAIPVGVKTEKDGYINDDNLHFWTATVFDVSQTEPLPNKPLPGITYTLTGGSNEKCISNGNTWAESRTEKAIEKVAP